jgi:hypothetical protein
MNNRDQQAEEDKHPEVTHKDMIVNDDVADTALWHL